MRFAVCGKLDSILISLIPFTKTAEVNVMPETSEKHSVKHFEIKGYYLTVFADQITIAYTPYISAQIGRQGYSS